MVCLMVEECWRGGCPASVCLPSSLPFLPSFPLFLPFCLPSPNTDWAFMIYKDKDQAIRYTGSCPCRSLSNGESREQAVILLIPWGLCRFIKLSWLNKVRNSGNALSPGQMGRLVILHEWKRKHELLTSVWFTCKFGHLTFFFWQCHMVLKISAPRPGTEPGHGSESSES